MKKMLIILAAMTLTGGAFALPYRSAREQALFLTDKMAYELDLTDDQYNAAYEINLDYFMSISYAGDILGVYWSRRDTELQYVLSPLQYRVFMQTEYFFRPVSWIGNTFHFLIYDRYARNRFFRPAPRVYKYYRGGNNTRYEHSPYNGRVYSNEPNRPVNQNPQAQQPSMTRRESIKEGDNRNRQGAVQSRQGTNPGQPGASQGSSRHANPTGSGNNRPGNNGR